MILLLFYYTHYMYNCKYINVTSIKHTLLYSLTALCWALSDRQTSTSYQGHLRGKVAIQRLSFIHCFSHSFLHGLPCPSSPYLFTRPNSVCKFLCSVTLFQEDSNPSPSQGSLLPRLEECGTTSSRKPSLTSLLLCNDDNPDSFHCLVSCLSPFHTISM